MFVLILHKQSSRIKHTFLKEGSERDEEVTYAYFTAHERRAELITATRYSRLRLFEYFIISKLSLRQLINYN